MQKYDTRVTSFVGGNVTARWETQLEQTGKIEKRTKCVATLHARVKETKECSSLREKFTRVDGAFVESITRYHAFMAKYAHWLGTKKKIVTNVRCFRECGSFELQALWCSVNLQLTRKYYWNCYLYPRQCLTQIISRIANVWRNKYFCKPLRLSHQLSITMSELQIIVQICVLKLLILLNCVLCITCILCIFFQVVYKYINSLVTSVVTLWRFFIFLHIIRIL